MLVRAGEKSRLLALFESSPYQLVPGSFNTAEPDVCHYLVSVPGCKTKVHVVELNSNREAAADAYIEVFADIAKETRADMHIFTLGSFIGAGKDVPAAYLKRRAQEVLIPINGHYTSTAALLGLRGTTGILGQGMIKLYQLLNPQHKQALFFDLEPAMQHLYREIIGRRLC